MIVKDYDRSGSIIETDSFVIEFGGHKFYVKSEDKEIAIVKAGFSMGGIVVKPCASNKITIS